MARLHYIIYSYNTKVVCIHYSAVDAKMVPVNTANGPCEQCSYSTTLVQKKSDDGLALALVDVKFE